jgi:hypothetical protein
MSGFGVNSKKRLDVNPKEIFSIQRLNMEDSLDKDEKQRTRLNPAGAFFVE